MLAVTYGQGQSYSVLQYSKNEGVPSSEVYEVYQDKKGFLWFATDNGVTRFDGSEMKNFHTRQGLSDGVVFGFHEDYKGRLWFRTFSGKLSYYENDSIHAYAYNDQLSKLNPKSIIGSIVIDTLDRLWFTTLRSTGIVGTINKEGKAQLNYLKGYQIHYQEIGNNVLLGYKQEEVHHISINNKKFSFVNYSSFCSQLQILSARCMGRIYFAVCRDLYEYDGKQFRHIITKSLPIVSLSVDKDDHLWLGYFSGGAERFTTRDFKEGWAPEFLRDVSVTKVLHDNNRGFWFSTLERGVLHVPDFSIQNRVLSTTQKIQFITAASNSVLVSTVQGNIISFDETGKITNTQNVEPPVMDLLRCRNNTIWLSNSIGTSVFDKGFKLKKRYPLMMTSMSEDKDGSVWGLNGKYIWQFTSDGEQVFFAETERHSRRLFVHDSLLLLAARSGLNFHRKNGDFIKTASNLSNFKISGIHKLNSSLLLITTIGDGFILYDMASKIQPWYSTENNFVANNIYCVAEVDSMMWMGTEKGIVKLNITALLNRKLVMSFLNTKSGVISNQINHLRYLPPSVWAFSDQGFSIIPAHAPLASQEVPKFYLKYFSTGGKSLNIQKEENVLKHNENNIQFAFGFIAFNQPPSYYRYRLNTLSNWNYTENKTIAFNSLAPASYKLELEYSNDNIQWSPAFISSWRIEPPLWQTWYFLGTVALLLVLLIFLYFRHQANIYRNHQQKLIQSEIEAIEQERSRIAKDLHDSVGTDFSAIKMTVSQLLKKHNDPQSEEVESHFQSTIQDIKSIIYGLAPPGLERYGLIAAVNNYVNKLNSTIPVKIELHTFGPDIGDPRINITVFRVLQELISNSLKHSSANLIDLHINSFEDLLNIVYEDNGKGFTSEATSSKGLGLYNIESRIQSVKGQLRFASGPFGTSYAIDIPLKKTQL
jgi:signal transduction histidine kinase/ligand-binding sensor domain-containing protein